MRIGFYCVIICLLISCAVRKKSDILLIENFSSLSEDWILEGHTFKSNLADFNPDNIEIAINQGCPQRNDNFVKGDSLWSLKNKQKSSYEIKEGLVMHLNHKPSMDKQFGGAEIRTKKSYKYGKFSATIKAPKGSGIVSAFFLYNGAKKKYNEIDFEFLGRDDKVIHTNHWVSNTDNGKDFPLKNSFEEAYHDYSIEWRKDFIAWSVDGQEVYRTEKDIPKVPMQLVLNIWISKYEDWAGKFYPDVLPQKLRVKTVTITK